MAQITWANLWQRVQLLARVWWTDVWHPVAVYLRARRIGRRWRHNSWRQQHLVHRSGSSLGQALGGGLSGLLGAPSQQGYVYQQRRQQLQQQLHNMQQQHMQQMQQAPPLTEAQRRQRDDALRNQQS